MFLKSNENENTTCQNLWGTGKAMLKGMFIAIRAYIKKNKNQRLPNKQHNVAH
jgi:hypothetical protein